jgi:hypothetical protein
VIAVEAPRLGRLHSGTVIAVHPVRGHLPIELWLYEAWLRGEAECRDLDEATEVRRTGLDQFMAAAGF